MTYSIEIHKDYRYIENCGYRVAHRADLYSEINGIRQLFRSFGSKEFKGITQYREWLNYIKSSCPITESNIKTRSTKTINESIKQVSILIGPLVILQYEIIEDSVFWKTVQPREFGNLSSLIESAMKLTNNVMIYHNQVWENHDLNEDTMVALVLKYS